MMQKSIQALASDNYAGICPEAMAMLVKANEGHAPAYGNDCWTRRACDLFREVFQAECEVFFVMNGTAANSLALASLCKSFNSIICNHLAHIETDECGAPEFFSHGAKLLLAEGEMGKIAPGHINALVNKRSDIHYPAPRAVSISQATELGTVYTQEEVAAIVHTAHALKLKVHIDGARFANAVADRPDLLLSSSSRSGIDVLSLGGTKSGLAFGDAVIFFDLEAADEFAYRCKQAGQLASKMRFLAAQWLGILADDVWLRYARHANACAGRLDTELRNVSEVSVLYPCEANAVFVEMPTSALDAMRQRGWIIYSFIGDGAARLMCSWDTREETIQRFIVDLKHCLRNSKANK